MDITEKYKNINSIQSTCYINKLEKKTMIHEINTLAKALIKNEKKFVKMQEAFKKQIKEYKKALKEKESLLVKTQHENESINEISKQLKSNTEHLMSDLLKQQKIAKDSIRALESLGDKYDKDKRELMIRLEKEKNEQIFKEEQRFEQKIKQFKAMNEQLNRKLKNHEDN